MTKKDFELKKGQVLTVKNLSVRFYQNEQTKKGIKPLEFTKRYTGDIQIRELIDRGTDFFKLEDIEICTGDVLEVNGGLENIGFAFPDKIKKATV